MREFEYKINFKPPPTKLTKQQQTICDLLLEGLSTKHIARKLGIGLRTIETHRKDICRRMGVENTIQLMHKVYEERIAKLTDGEAVERAMAIIEMHRNG